MSGTYKTGLGAAIYLGAENTEVAAQMADDWLLRVKAEQDKLHSDRMRELNTIVARWRKGEYTCPRILDDANAYIERHRQPAFCTECGVQCCVALDDTVDGETEKEIKAGHSLCCGAEILVGKSPMELSEDGG